MMWRVVRRILALFIRVFIWHPVVSLVVTCLALFVIGWRLGGMNDPQVFANGVATSQTLAASASTTSPTTPLTTQAAPATAPPPAVDEYIKGMTTFDARLMWDALDPKAIQAMVTQGGSQQALQQRLDDAKQSGARYDDVTFIGGYPLKTGEKYFFFVVTRHGFAAPGQADQVFFVFTVGQTGKIVKIE
jgi:hypothetical protein